MRFTYGIFWLHPNASIVRLNKHPFLAPSDDVLQVASVLYRYQIRSHENNDNSDYYYLSSWGNRFIENLATPSCPRPCWHFVVPQSTAFRVCMFGIVALNNYPERAILYINKFIRYEVWGVHVVEMMQLNNDTDRTHTDIKRQDR